ncbi:MAG TPA: GldG family protein [Burkholderiales bacterium]|nr:GldG family protein [Burkholderiales bacterium]
MATNRHREVLWYSAGGVIALVAVLIAVNFIVSPFSLRADLTEGDVYTLSPATRSVLSRLQEPVRIRFYYTQGSNAVPVGLKTFAQRVEDLLNEYKAAAKGKLVIERLNPEPDSDAEESAALDNVEGQMTNTGEKFYLGLSISRHEKKEAIPVLSPDRERLLEYDITRAIAKVAADKKPVVGLMSALPVLGRPLNPLTKQQPTQPWVVGNELKNLFDVRQVPVDTKKIEDDIQVLLVIHPRNITEEGEYAIDQFVLRGGKLIAFMDPYAYFDQQPDMMNPFGGSNAGQSVLFTLLKGWGLELTLNQVVADMTYASGAGPRLLPTLLQLPAEALNQDDVVMSQVGSLLVPFSGVFKGKPAEGLTQTVLAHTSKNSMMVDLIIATLSGEPSTRGFQPSGEEMPLAIRLAGKFKSAFPNGPPEPMGRRDEKKAEPAKPEAKAPHLREAAQETQVVLVGDVDLLTDGAAVEVQEVFGQKLVVPRGGNIALLLGLVEQFSGDQNLMGLRSRASFTRPLTVVRQMEAQAQQLYLGKIKELEDSLQQTQEKLQELQKGKQAAAGSATILTPEQQAEIDKFREQTIKTRAALKEVRKNLRVETDRLEFWTKVVNIGLVPLLVAVLGIALALAKRRRVAAAARRA